MGGCSSRSAYREDMIIYYLYYDEIDGWRQEKVKFNACITDKYFSLIKFHKKLNKFTFYLSYYFYYLYFLIFDLKARIK